MFCPSCGTSEVDSKEKRMADVRSEVIQTSEKPLATALVGPLVDKVAGFFGAEWTKNRCRKCGHTWRLRCRVSGLVTFPATRASTGFSLSSSGSYIMV